MFYSYFVDDMMCSLDEVKIWHSQLGKIIDILENPEVEPICNSTPAVPKIPIGVAAAVSAARAKRAREEEVIDLTNDEGI